MVVWFVLIALVADRSVIGGQKLFGRVTSGIGDERVYFVGGVTGSLLLEESPFAGVEAPGALLTSELSRKAINKTIPPPGVPGAGLMI